MKRRNFIQNSALAGISMLFPFKSMADKSKSIVYQSDLLACANTFFMQVGVDGEGHMQISVDGVTRLFRCRAY